MLKSSATRAGTTLEEATYRGVSIYATASFTVSKCIAVAEAVEQGLKRREHDGRDILTMGPVCTIMVRRLDDWLKVVMEQQDIITDPRYLKWVEVAVLKKAYRIFRDRGCDVRRSIEARVHPDHWANRAPGHLGFLRRGWAAHPEA